MNMHAGEVAIDAALVARLVAAQLPHLATQPIQAVHSIGTVNAIYRLGDELCVRLPRLAAWAADLEREQAWLPYLAPHLSLRIPTPLARGEPSDEYPFPWAIYRWIDGRPYHDDLIADERRAAVDLAQFVIELRRIDPRGAPAGGRRPLNELDAQTRTALADSQSLIDTPAALAVWRYLLATPASHGTPVWIHADLLRPNLLVESGRLYAVIDFGGAGVGDPAADVIAAWSVFGPAGRAAFRTALGVDDPTWHRACGYALHQAALIIPYYSETNPAFVALARRTIAQILSDPW